MNPELATILNGAGVIALASSAILQGLVIRRQERRIKKLEAGVDLVARSASRLIEEIQHVHGKVCGPDTEGTVPAGFLTVDATPDMSPEDIAAQITEKLTDVMKVEKIRREEGL